MPALISLYELQFANADFEVVNTIVTQLVRVCKFAPTMQEIITEIDKIKESQQMLRAVEEAKSRLPFKQTEESKAKNKQRLAEIKQKLMA